MRVSSRLEKGAYRVVKGEFPGRLVWQVEFFGMPCAWFPNEDDAKEYVKAMNREYDKA